ncbi:MAG: class I SAM-dependent methyltransferase [Egibacteraceae bacterium]
MGADLPPPGQARVQENITGFWDNHALAYDEHEVSRLHTGLARDAWAGVWRSALPTPPADVLEVATGTGQVALLLAELGYCVTGIDLAEGMLSLARAKGVRMTNPPGAAVRRRRDPPFPPASFDAVVSRYLLWTLREPQVAVANWRRLLRPGGALVAVDGPWFADNMLRDTKGLDSQEREEYLRHYDEQVVASLPLACATPVDTFVAIVGEAGFSDVRVTPLPEIERLERELLADTSEVLLQFMVTARSE